MQTSTPIIDLHLHSTLKPYGNSFYKNNNPVLVTNSSCIWFSDFRTRTDTKIEDVVGISRYRQSDFMSLTEGQVKIACVSLYPVEKEFFQLTKSRLKPLSTIIGQFASQLGKNRINNIIAVDFDYFKDLCNEYSFLCLLHNTLTDGRKYNVIGSANDISQNSNLVIIPTIEGCHAFCDGNDIKNPAAWDRLAENVEHVKNWQHPPFFVTLAHHFYNGLCTHSKSLFESSGKLLNQSYGMREYDYIPNDGLDSISTTGYKLINLLLQRNDNGRRILIDVKHMSLDARIEYYKILERDYPDVPVIWSHGAVDKSKQINLNPEIDIAAIYKTNGIIGIEMDQRILSYNKNRFIKWLKAKIWPRNKYYTDAAYFFNQIIEIAEYAYKNGYTTDPWSCIALGSDYDGIINPLNAYPDAVSLSKLYQNLIVHMQEYWSEKSPMIPQNHLGPEDVIYNIMYKNAYNFIQKYY